MGRELIGEMQGLGSSPCTSPDSPQALTAHTANGDLRPRHVGSPAQPPESGV